jgi:hypothetical protein
MTELRPQTVSIVNPSSSCRREYSHSSVRGGAEPTFFATSGAHHDGSDTLNSVPIVEHLRGEAPSEPSGLPAEFLVMEQAGQLGKQLQMLAVSPGDRPTEIRSTGWRLMKRNPQAGPSGRAHPVSGTTSQSAWGTATPPRFRWRRAVPGRGLQEQLFRIRQRPALGEEATADTKLVLETASTPTPAHLASRWR